MLAFSARSISTISQRSRGKRSARRKAEGTTVLGLEELESRLVPSPVPLHVAGNLLKDPNNTTVVLRGVDIPSLEYYPEGVNIQQSLALSINDWHANVIRLPVNQDYWFGYYDNGDAND